MVDTADEAEQDRVPMPRDIREKCRDMALFYPMVAIANAGGNGLDETLYTIIPLFEDRMKHQVPPLFARPIERRKA